MPERRTKTPKERARAAAAQARQRGGRLAPAEIEALYRDEPSYPDPEAAPEDRRIQTRIVEPGARRDR